MYCEPLDQTVVCAGVALTMAAGRAGVDLAIAGEAAHA
jgi:hypothetical protein